jgi:hypothetical protein
MRSFGPAFKDIFTKVEKSKEENGSPLEALVKASKDLSENGTLNSALFEDINLEN